MYSKSVNEKGNKALELRMKLKKNEPSLVYVKYPAVLMMKSSTKHKYTVETEF